MLRAEKISQRLLEMLRQSEWKKKCEISLVDKLILQLWFVSGLSEPGGIPRVAGTYYSHKKVYKL